MAKKKRNSTPVKKEAVEQPMEEASEIPGVELPLYKDGSNDSIRVARKILGYCVMDHEPELAVRQKEQGDKFIKRPHVLLSLAAMSKHFRDHVNIFSRLELMRNKDAYRFKTNTEIEGKRSLRLSPRIKAQPSVDTRCYRMELVKHIQSYCIRCKMYTKHFAMMANSIKCHQGCERFVFPGVIDLTTALRRYDLRDWMLIKTRKPGPRAKKIDLPTIHYGTIRIGTPLSLGMTTSYRFYDDQVKSIAKIVHGNVDEHMKAKQKQKSERRAKKRREVHRELKVRYHADLLELFSRDERDQEDREYHQGRLTYYTSLEYDYDDDSELEYDYPPFEYGEYEDLHSRLCDDKATCDICWEDAMRKYHDWFF